MGESQNDFKYYQFLCSCNHQSMKVPQMKNRYTIVSRLRETRRSSDQVGMLHKLERSKKKKQEIHPPEEKHF